MSTAVSIGRQTAAHDRVREVPLFDLTGQRQRLGGRIEARIDEVLKHGQFILGPEVDEVEARLAEFCGARHAIAVSSGRDALTMALMALGVGPGDAVFVPGFTFSATAGAIAPLGADPVFVDVDLKSFNMDPAALDAAIVEVVAEGRLTPRVVMPVDLYGLPADYPAIGEVAARHGMTVLADAAQSFGGAMAGRHVGQLAPISATSFYPTKPLGAYGDGGAIFTEDGDLADAVRQIRTHGRQGSGDEAMRLGMTGRLDTIQAAVLLVKLEGFEAELRHRADAAAAYTEMLSEVVATPALPSSSVSAWALYTIRTPGRDRLKERLDRARIGSGLFYRVPLHRHPALQKWVPEGLTLPVSERLADEVLSLPIHADITEAEIHYVTGQVLAALD